MVNILSPLLLIFLCTRQVLAPGKDSSDNESDAFLSQDIVESNLSSANDTRFELCLYARKEYLCDPDKMLSDKEREQIDSELKTIEAMTRQNDSRSECNKQGMIVKLLLFDRYQESIKTLIGNQSLAERWDFAYKCARMQFIYYTATDKVFGYIGSFFMLKSWLKLRGVEKEKIYSRLETILPVIKTTVASQIGDLNDSYGISSPLHWDFWLCGLQEPGFVCNPDGVLRENEQKQLELELNYLKQHTVFKDSNEPCMKKGVYGFVIAVEVM
ncbi:modulator of levamisole receptor-1 domain-containing protein [Ditylenchus destructor]|uniref:Modulator of levamisole receptor-1 domain-containing protein n=1 Tax=Ditylenchus destructor TaxID=166010 RepID=A0AAD4MYN6_9BILA|nr:modulator of levamisole receptor-1 domain-containing protein [Ditylenchus destructor]